MLNLILPPIFSLFLTVKKIIVLYQTYNYEIFFFLQYRIINQL